MEGDTLVEDTDPNTLYKAIEVFKSRYGIQEPLDSKRLDSIIVELKAEANKNKRRKRNGK